jgi:hypothetical protein
MAKLTEQEQQEIIRFLEADKPLPDKYRFLLFDDKREVELVWNGKTGDVCNVVLPFQVIEQVDEPRSEKELKLQSDLFNPTSGRQQKGWTNKLIWGDNKLILSSLKSGPLREEIEKQGGLKLIYIDPPFDVGADFSMDIEIGDDTFTKRPNVLEELAYRDTWGKGADSFIAMIYERLVLMRDLLAEDGSIYVHIDYRLVAPVRLILDEVFGAPRFVNEIVWKRGNHKKTENMFLISHDNLLMYSKSDKYVFNPQFGPYEKEYLDKYYGNYDPDGRRYQLQGMYGKGAGPAMYFGDRLITPPKAAFLDLVLRAYQAEKTDGFGTFHGKKAGRLVAIGPVNMPVTRLFVEEVILECRKKHITRVDILGFEFEMGLFPNVLDDAKAKGIDIAPKYIPADVFDKRAVEKNQVVFHDVSFIEVKPHVKGHSVAVELTDFSVFYSQDSIAAAEASLKDKQSKIVVEKGQIVKVSKDKSGVVSRETLTRHWTDWIDYWSVDFDFESKREIIRTQNPATGETEETWTGDYVFENEWQSFRTRKDRTLEMTSVFQEVPPGRRKVAVKVVDIFGNDTMTIIEVNVGGKK